MEVLASGGKDPGAMAVILTGDGGWADIDKSVAAGLAAAGVPVVGWSSLRYYWTPRTPEAAARDLARIVEHYSAAWKKQRVLLVGYSFGADVLPFLVNRLPAPALARISSVSLLGLSDTAAFEFHLSSWLGGGGDARRLTAPEVARLTLPVTCVHGDRREGLGLPGLERSARPGSAPGQRAPLRWQLRASGRADPGSDCDAMSVRLSPSAALGLSAALVILAGIGDHISGNDVAFTLIYLAPVALATWSAGRASGLVVAAAAALGSLVVNRSHVPSLSPAVQAWNLAAELGVFATTAALLASLKQRLELESERALTDVLTGLKNRRAFHETAVAEMERARRHGRPFTLALLDLDGFKQINDTLGHEAGDAALVTVSGVLRRRSRVVDIVARLGGDEFALLLPETAAPEAATVVRDLLQQVASSMQARGWAVGFSLGAVTFDSVPGSLDEALREADTLLYQAKRAGKGQVRHETRPTGS